MLGSKHNYTVIYLSFDQVWSYNGSGILKHHLTCSITVIMFLLFAWFLAGPYQHVGPS